MGSAGSGRILRCAIFTKMFQLLIAISAVFASVASVPAQAAGDAFPVRCVGKPDATRRAVFLHGRRPGSTPFVEAGMVLPLAQLAEKLGYRIAIPEATTLCEGHAALYCWRGERLENLARTWAAVTAAAATCFPNGAQDEDFGVIGFSNGGYHVAKVVMRGLAPHPKWAVSIGAAGHISNAEGASASAKAIPFTVIAGKRDGVNREARTLASSLATRGYAVEFREVEGGHGVPLAELEALMVRWGRVASR